MTNPSDPWAERPDSPDTPTEQLGASGEAERHTTEYSDGYGLGNDPTVPHQYFGQSPRPNPTRELPPYQSQWGVYDTPTGYESQWGGPTEPLHAPPHRSRRGLWLVLTLGIFAAVVLGAIAVGLFLADHDSSSSTAAATNTGPASTGIPMFPQTPGGTLPQLPGMGGTIDSLGATMGTISTNDGSTLTIDSLSGSTVTVHTDAKTQVLALGAGTLADLHPGDMVVVQGDKNPDGSILAKIIIGTALPTPTPTPVPTR
jgi:hypothetical protein